VVSRSFIVVVALLVAGCSSVSVTPTQQPPSSSVATPGVTATAPATPTVTATATATPTDEPTPTTPPTPTAQPSPSVEPSPTGVGGEIAEDADEVLNTLTGGRIRLPSGVTVLEDPTGDQFSFTGAPGTTTPWMDIIAAVGFLTEFDSELADFFSGALACPETTAGGILVAGVPQWDVSCNQDMPFRPGQHALILTAWNGLPPDPFPATANCSWAVQTNVDGDLTTGFPNPPPGHPLTGSEIYHEMLMFYGREGDFQNYNLMTDYREPPRTDTGQQQGNVATTGRSAVFGDVIRDRMWMINVLPSDHFGDNYNAHGYCFGDVNDRPNTLAIDVIDHPFGEEIAFYEALIEAFRPPD
jgi:hypothetical protein